MLCVVVKKKYQSSKLKFHEYWENENKLLDLSYKESIRQREERKLKSKTKKTNKG